MIPQFRREVLIMYELNHPHIIKLYNHFEDEKSFYLIMEIADGGNLFHRLYRERSFLEKIAAQYFREIILAVEYLHSHVPAIIHRDIKPENILIDKDGRLKLTDFGWSNYYSAESGAPRYTTCGTLEYLPPEIVSEAGHSTAADIWCMGILLFEMLAGGTPFKSPRRDNMLANIVQAKPKYPLSLPPLAKDLISQCLERDPNKRPTATQAKEHRWLLEHVPLRETITQDALPKKLPDLAADSPKIISGYEVINKLSENSLKEDGIEQEPLAETPYKKSIHVLKDHISSKAEDLEKSKSKINKNAEKISQFTLKIKEIEERILEQRNEYNRLVVAEKECLLKISDTNLDLERLESVNDLTNLNEQVNSRRKEHMEKSQQVKLFQKNLESLREEVKGKSLEVAEKEREFKAAEAHIKRLKEDSSQRKLEKNSELSSLVTNAEVLKSQIERKYKSMNNLGKEESNIAKELMRYVRDKLHDLDGNSKHNLEKKVSEINEQVLEREQLLLESKLDYEDHKSKITQYIRTMKEDTIKALRKNTEEKNRQISEKREKYRENLKEKLNQARISELKFYVEPIQIDQLKEKLKAIQNSSQKINKNMEKIIEERAMLKEVQSVKQRQVEDIEMEIGTLKVTLLGKGIY